MPRDDFYFDLESERLFTQSRFLGVVPSEDDDRYYDDDVEDEPPYDVPEDWPPDDE